VSHNLVVPPEELLVWALGRDWSRGLIGIKRLSDVLSEAEGRHVRAARAAGASWRDIGSCRGVPQQTMHRRWAGTITAQPP
jgi:hypothetical protein